MVMRFAWIASKFVSSNSFTNYASHASCRARVTAGWNHGVLINSLAISRTRSSNGNFLIDKSVDCCNRRISSTARVPGRQRCGLDAPAVAFRRIHSGTFYAVTPAVRRFDLLFFVLAMYSVAGWTTLKYFFIIKMQPKFLPNECSDKYSPEWYIVHNENGELISGTQAYRWFY